MANISTSTVAYATRQTAGQLVFIASDGATCVLWCDGTNQVLSYEDNTYATWTKATLTTGLNMCLAGHFRAGTDNIDEVTGGASNVRGNYRLLTKSGATWTVGTANGASGSTAIGVTAQGSPTNYIGQDAQGRHWIVVSGATNTLETSYYSVANAPTNTGWTNSGAVTQTADLFTPAADQVGNYLIKIYWNGTALQWHRIDNSVASLGSWTTGATIANLTGSPNASHAVNFKAISATQGLLTYSSGSGVYAQLYTAASDSFGAATQLSTNANDRHPTIAVDGAGNAWVVWCKYAAANSFSLVYKKYSGSWGTETELVASGTNITYPNAGYGAKTLGVVYTQGTGSPYTVGWAYQMFGGTRTISATASLEGSPPLTLYGSATADATLPNACDVATVAGGVETSKVSTYASGTGDFGEVRSKGGSFAILSAIPTTPTGYGWGYQPGAGTFLAANWDAIITCSNTVNSGSWRLRFFKYDGATTWTPIVTLTTAISATAKTIYNFPAAAASAVTFLSTDWLYWDLWYENSTGGASDSVTCYMATTSAAGVANEMQIATPVFNPAPISGGSRTIGSDAALLLEKSQTITAVTATLLLEKSRPISTVTGSLSIARSLATSAALLLEKNRTSGTTTAALLLEKSRAITTITGALLVEKSRTITTVAGSLAYLALSRNIGSDAALSGAMALTLYGSAEADSTLPTACQMGTTSGGVETSKAITITSGGTTDVELWSQGQIGAAGVNGLPAPTGHGWVYYPGAGTFAAGNWSAAFTMSLVVTGATGNTTLRFYKRASGVYTSIGTITVVTKTVAKTTYTFSATSMPTVTFGAGDALYVDLWYHDASIQVQGDNPTIYLSTTAAAGVANDLQIATTVFTPAISGGSRTLTSDASLLLEKTRTITTITAALLLEKSRPVTSTASLSAARTFATSAALLLEKNRTSGTTMAALLLEKTRTITTVTGALFLAKSRTITASGSLAYLALTRSIGSSTSLFVQKTNTVGSSAALLLEKARTSGSTVSLLLEKSRTVTSNVALSQLGTLARTVPSNTSLSLTKRTVGSSTALSLEQSRAIGSSAALSRVGTRSVASSVILSLTQVRTAGSSATLFVQKSNTVPSSTALLLEKTRTFATTGSLAAPGTNTRTVPASGALSLAVRTIPASASLRTVSTRTITATLALLVQKARTVPQTGAVSWQQSRGIASTGAILATKTRTLASSVACSLSSARTLPSSAALLSVGSRPIPSSVALLVSRTRTVTATGALSGARAIPSSVALKATLARSMAANTVLASGYDHTVPCSVALFLEGEERPCPAWVALSLFIANARVTVPSGYALVKLP